jgi:hypothetical protein
LEYLAISIIALGLAISIIGTFLYFGIKKADNISARCWDIKCAQTK